MIQNVFRLRHGHFIRSAACVLVWYSLGNWSLTHTPSLYWLQAHSIGSIVVQSCCCCCCSRLASMLSPVLLSALISFDDDDCNDGGDVQTCSASCR